MCTVEFDPLKTIAAQAHGHWVFIFSCKEQRFFSASQCSPFNLFLRSYIHNSCFVFHQRFQTPRNNKSTPPTASCFHQFLFVWNLWWNTRTRWYITSNWHLHSRMFLITFHLYWIWVPISFGIRFKIALLTYKATNDLAPSYISDLISINSDTRYSLSLWSANDLRLIVLLHKSYGILGDRLFSMPAPQVWNSLPTSIRKASTIIDFKRQLKSHYFKFGYFS